jgi:hypothetical protein
MGPKGATGATGAQLPDGVNYSDYLFWDPSNTEWKVGSAEVHLGMHAGLGGQGSESVAIGTDAGQAQGLLAVAIGSGAGNATQGINTVAIGSSAGFSGQKNYAVAVGNEAGYSGQGTDAVAVGNGAGNTGQGTGAVALGTTAGSVGQGPYSIAIGFQAGFNNQAAKSIILNANDFPLEPTTAGLFIDPVRDQAQSGPSATVGVMWYDSSSKEITWEQTAKSFIINHPISPDRYLVHACLEGPEAGVYYRGESELTDGETKITLPDYVPDMADNFTVQLTQIWRGPEDSFARLSATRVDDDGAFTVHGDPCAFAWHVHGTRQYIDTEPLKAEVSVAGDGPYRYIR